MTTRLRALYRRGVTWLQILTVACVASAAIGASSAEAVVSAAMVVDAKTGKVLYSSNADTRTYPASLTKMMTLYLLFEALDSGKVSLSSRITVSAHAAAQPPSKLGLKPGQTIAVKDAILALVTRSANDIAAAIGEYLGGSESSFAVQMTARARSLGMKNTTFRNASGLPDSAQVTTARDMSILGRALQDRFPAYFSYFKTTTFTYNGAKIGNHNRLLGKINGVDGIKTGYIRAAGFNLVTSVNLPDRRLVAVVLGGSTASSRDQRMAGLIKTYIPQASAGPQIAGRILPAGAPTVASLPSPRPRPDGDGGIETGSVVTTVADVVSDEPRSQGDIGDDMVDTATTPVISGWKIQIAATPSQASALELLQKAQATGTSVLGDASPYTEPVVKDSTTLYRARFAGFTTKQEAWDACAYLTKQKFACYAIAE
jgi:D-alanyl-D-alanine carboxypeptidase